MKRQILLGLFLLTVFCAVSINAQSDSKDTPYFNDFRLKNINLLCACEGGEEREKLKVLTGNIWKILSKNASLSFSLNNNEIRVTGTKEKLLEVEKLIKSLDNSSVLLEKIKEKQNYPKLSILYCLKHLPSAMVQHWEFSEETEKWHKLIEDKKSPTGQITYYTFAKHLSLEDTPQEAEKLERFLESIDKPAESDLLEGETRTEKFVLKNMQLGYCGENGIASSPNKQTHYLIYFLESYLSSRAKIEIDIEANAVTVIDTPSKFEGIKKYFEQVDKPESYVNKEKGCFWGYQTNRKLTCN